MTQHSKRHGELCDCHITEKPAPASEGTTPSDPAPTPAMISGHPCDCGDGSRPVLHSRTKCEPAPASPVPEDAQQLLKEADAWHENDTTNAQYLIPGLASLARSALARAETLTQETQRYREQWYSGAFASERQEVTPTEPLTDEELRYTAANAKAFVEGRDWPVVTQLESAKTILRLTGEIRRLEEAKTHEIAHWFNLYEGARSRAESAERDRDDLQRLREGSMQTWERRWKRMHDALGDGKLRGVDLTIDELIERLASARAQVQALTEGKSAQRGQGHGDVGADQDQPTDEAHRAL